jgi:glycosyltransferase involved in cell wall biosynthesis
MSRELAASDLRSFASLLRFFRRRSFAFVQTHTPKASLLGLPAARLSGTPAIYTMHGSFYFRGNGPARNLPAWFFERWCCSWADAVALQSREDVRAMARVRICPARKLNYVGNGIAVDHFLEPVAPAIDEAPDAPPVVLMVSRLVKHKGCVDFFAVARSLKGKARFVHVGPFEEDQADRIRPEEVEALRAEGVVEFIGMSDDVRPWVASAALVVLPSYQEGIPRAAMEAALMGKPVVAYDIRGVREVIQPETGLLVHKGDVTALTDTVAGLLVDRDRRAALGRACSDHVLANFDEAYVVGRLRALYARTARTRTSERA